MCGSVVGFEGEVGVVEGGVCPVVGTAEVEASGVMAWLAGIVAWSEGVEVRSEEGVEGIADAEGEAVGDVAWAEGAAGSESETTGVVVRAAVGMVKVSF